MMYVLLAIE